MKRTDSARLQSIRLVAMDLDCTLLRSDKSISERTAETLKQVIASGIQVVVASGRPYTSLPACVMEIPGLNYAITSNGVAVHHLPGGERCSEQLLEPESVMELIDKLPAGQILETFIRGKAYAEAAFVAAPQNYGLRAGGIAYIQSTRTPVEDMPSFIRAHANELDCLDVVVTPEDDYEELRRIAESVPGVYVTSSNRQLLEISHASCGKESALEILCGMLGLGWEQAAAFGDAENDLGMICKAGLGVAMGNAVPEVKAAAHRVTDTCDRDGVAMILEEILEELRRKDDRT